MPDPNVPTGQGVHTSEVSPAEVLEKVEMGHRVQLVAPGLGATLICKLFPCALKIVVPIVHVLGVNLLILVAM